MVIMRKEGFLSAVESGRFKAARATFVKAAGLGNRSADDWEANHGELAKSNGFKSLAHE